jgi:hypothetical protein
VVVRGVIAMSAVHLAMIQVCMGKPKKVTRKKNCTGISSAHLICFEEVNEFGLAPMTCRTARVWGALKGAVRCPRPRT